MTKEMDKININEQAKLNLLAGNIMQWIKINGDKNTKIEIKLNHVTISNEIHSTETRYAQQG